MPYYVVASAVRHFKLILVTQLQFDLPTSMHFVISFGARLLLDFQFHALLSRLL